MNYYALLFLIIFCSNNTLAQPERWYQDRFCKGKTEFRLHDRTRVDCLTETHAIEYDFGKKWSEAIGQSLGYAFETNKRAGIVLILESKDDYRYWIKMNSIIDHYNLPIDTWRIEGWNKGQQVPSR